MRDRQPGTRTLAAAVLPPAGGAAAVALWWAAVLVFDIPPYVLPTPAAVARVFAAMPGELLSQAAVTLGETLAGYGLAVAGGVLGGVAIAGSRSVEQAVYPLLVALNAAPKAAVVPLLVIWLGFGAAPKVVLAVLFCFFPVTLATAAGLRSTPAELVELARSLSASRWQTFAKVRVPAALPQVFVGLKVALPLAPVGAVVGELFAADAGLGYLITASGGTGDVALAFAAVTVLSAMSVVLYAALLAVERLALPWLPAVTA